MKSRQSPHSHLALRVRMRALVLKPNEQNISGSSDSRSNSNKSVPDAPHECHEANCAHTAHMAPHSAKINKSRTFGHMTATPVSSATPPSHETIEVDTSVRTMDRQSSGLPCASECNAKDYQKHSLRPPCWEEDWGSVKT